MAPEKVTTMNLKVDLQCEKCYKKVKKVLSKFPQITDQLYDEKKSIVTVKVVCCSPEKVRDRLCYKGGGSIKSIEIVEPSKAEPPKQAPPKTEPPPVKPKEQEPAGTQEGSKVIKPIKKVTFKDPPAVQVASKYPQMAPVSVLAYPASGQPVGLFYYGGPEGLTPFYERPIYDCYGWGGPTYLSNPLEGEESWFTIV